VHFARVSADEPSRVLALTLNPMALILGRLSGNLEWALAPHHALVVSPNVIVAQVSRGGRNSLVSQAYGFVTPGSSSVGLELGYHYWWHRRPALRGVFFGPSLLLGSTTEASTGDPSHAQTYAGAAFDVGAQEVIAGGFTIGGGAGLGFVRMADSTVLFPRFLLQLGWSF
jgi:hypothetical protein